MANGNGKFAPLLFGGIQGLTEEGLPAYIEEKYSQTLAKAGWWGYDGLWKFAATGLGKGLALTAATVATAFTVGGSLISSSGVAAGLVEGFTAGLSFMGSGVGLGILAFGALAGAASDIAVRQRVVRAELADNRKMMRDLKNIVQEYELSAVNSMVEREMDMMKAEEAASAASSIMEPQKTRPKPFVGEAPKFEEPPTYTEETPGQWIAAEAARREAERKQQRGF